MRDEFPDWNDVMKGRRVADFAHIDKSFCVDQVDVQQRVNGSETRVNVMSKNELFTYANEDQHDYVSPGQNDKHDKHEQLQDQVAENSTVRMNNGSEDVSRENVSTSNNQKVNKPLIQLPMFRPFNTVANSNPHESTNNVISNQNHAENSNTEHVSRSLQRGHRRIQSMSIPRSRKKVPRDGEENPRISKNRPSEDINCAQHKQSQVNVSRGSSKSPHKSIKRQIGEDDCVHEKAQGNTHYNT